MKVEIMGDYLSYNIDCFLMLYKHNYTKNMISYRDLLWLKMIINFHKKKLPVNQSKEKEKETITIAHKIDTQGQVKGRNDHKDIDKTSQPFNIEHEVGKINIHVPLVELAKNPIYQRTIEKVMYGTYLNNKLDTLSIHNDVKP
jgi:hypothetical protein